jgi:hypothetical protein
VAVPSLIGERQTADSRQQTADSRQQTADSRQQTADSRQQKAVPSLIGERFHDAEVVSHLIRHACSIVSRDATFWREKWNAWVEPVRWHSSGIKIVSLYNCSAKKVDSVKYKKWKAIAGIREKGRVVYLCVSVQS